MCQALDWVLYSIISFQPQKLYEIGTIVSPILHMRKHGPEKLVKLPKVTQLWNVNPSSWLPEPMILLNRVNMVTLNISYFSSC